MKTLLLVCLLSPSAAFARGYYHYHGPMTRAGALGMFALIWLAAAGCLIYHAYGLYKEGDRSWLFAALASLVPLAGIWGVHLYGGYSLLVSAGVLWGIILIAAHTEKKRSQ